MNKYVGYCLPLFSLCVFQREAWESSDTDDEDPFAPRPSKKPKKIPPAKKLTQEPCQMNKVLLL